MTLSWRNAEEIENRGWRCGYCGRDVGGNIGYRQERDGRNRIYICPFCKNPTAFIYSGCLGYEQYPGAGYGHEVDSLPPDVGAMYGEVRRCIQYTAYTSAVLSMRKLLMHVAVEQGADEGMHFVKCIDYLDENYWIPPNGREWVDAIRKSGNEANHEIVISGEDDAKQLLDFVEMLLKLVYEFPARLRR